MRAAPLFAASLLSAPSRSTAQAPWAEANPATGCKTLKWLGKKNYQYGPLNSLDECAAKVEATPECHGPPYVVAWERGGQHNCQCPEGGPCEWDDTMTGYSLYMRGPAVPGTGGTTMPLPAAPRQWQMTSATQCPAKQLLQLGTGLTVAQCQQQAVDHGRCAGPPHAVNFDAGTGRCRCATGDCADRGGGSSDLYEEVFPGRHFKRGLAHAPQGCDAQEPWSTMSWAYDWTLKDDRWEERGCSTAQSHRNRVGIEYVPMFWGEAGFKYDKNIDITKYEPAILNAFGKAKYLLTINEPEAAGQANMGPKKVAEYWPKVVEIAEEYTLKIIAPCLTNGEHWWYDDWLEQCTILYGKWCEFDFTCTHFYNYPSPGTDVPWLQAFKTMGHVDDWYVKYQKPMWVTEWACAWWAAKAGIDQGMGTPYCDADAHAAYMCEMLPQFDASDAVFRYAWFTTGIVNAAGANNGGGASPNAFEADGTCHGECAADWPSGGGSFDGHYLQRWNGWRADGAKGMGCGSTVLIAAGVDFMDCSLLVAASPICQAPSTIAWRKATWEAKGDCECSIDDCATRVAAAGVQVYRLLSPPLTRLGRLYDAQEPCSQEPSSSPSAAPQAPAVPSAAPAASAAATSPSVSPAASGATTPSASPASTATTSSATVPSAAPVIAAVATPSASPAAAASTAGIPATVPSAAPASAATTSNVAGTTATSAAATGSTATSATTGSTTAGTTATGTTATGTTATGTTATGTTATGTTATGTTATGTTATATTATGTTATGTTATSVTASASTGTSTGNTATSAAATGTTATSATTAGSAASGTTATGTTASGGAGTGTTATGTTATGTTAASATTTDTTATNAPTTEAQRLAAQDGVTPKEDDSSSWWLPVLIVLIVLLLCGLVALKYWIQRRTLQDAQWVKEGKKDGGDLRQVNEENVESPGAKERSADHSLNNVHPYTSELPATKAVEAKGSRRDHPLSRPQPRSEGGPSGLKPASQPTPSDGEDEMGKAGSPVRAAQKPRNPRNRAPRKMASAGGGDEVKSKPPKAQPGQAKEDDLADTRREV